MARAGHSVVALERDAVYVDRVRGEGMAHWGFEAASELGVIDAIVAAPGASFMSRLVAYDELLAIDDARARAVDLSMVLPGVPGLLSVGHPEMRTAVSGLAVAAGASVLRGVSDVDVTPGTTPRVTYVYEGVRHTLSCRLVIGADGKDSATRRALGRQLESTVARIMLTGMLVDDDGVWDRNEVTIGVHGGDQLYVFPRKGAVRLYVARPLDAERLVGPDRQRKMLDAFRVTSLPHSDALSEAQPIGPCASFPMTDTWTRLPYGPGVVLVGDAAGWSNPVTGQGLAVAMRDSKVVTELLLNDAQWNTELFDQYAIERHERMRRLRFASALTDLLAAQGVHARADRVRRMRRCGHSKRSTKGRGAWPRTLSSRAF
jgi:2-polyprenyl-6-methoxyphenol hydroxylase-like FAD-dependent oxidoreductase